MLKVGASDYSSRRAIAIKCQQSAAQQRLASLSLLAVFGLTGINWVMADAIAPVPAHAYTATVNVALSSQVGESYQSFIRRAEAVARAAAQRSFDRDILVTDVAVTIVGQNDGAIVPILALEVSRQRWRSRPDAQRWARYFPDTQTLLRFNQTTPLPQAPDEPTPAPMDSPVPPDGAPPRVIQLPGGVRLIPNPGGGGEPRQNNAPNQGRAGSNTPQQNNTPNQGRTRSNTPQQNNTPNQQAPANAPPPAAPGRVIELPGGVRLIPNPGGS